LDDKDRAVARDPLPWLKLPKLDFVEVAGQEPDTTGAEEQQQEKSETLKGTRQLQVKSEELNDGNGES